MTLPVIPMEQILSHVRNLRENGGGMIKRVPLLDPTSGQQFMLNGETTDIVPNDRTVYIDQQGNTYDPSQRNVSFKELPESGVLELPRTTWWSDHDSNREILHDGTIVHPLPLDQPTKPDQPTSHVPLPGSSSTTGPDVDTGAAAISADDGLLLRLPSVVWFLLGDPHPLSVDEGSL